MRAMTIWFTTFLLILLDLRSFLTSCPGQLIIPGFRSKSINRESAPELGCLALLLLPESAVSSCP